MRCHSKLKNLTISNGMAWSSDKKTFYFIDSPTNKVFAFDYFIENGDITNKRVEVEIPPSLGVPDGMTIDEEDGLWVALWGGGKVIRLDPASRMVVQTINLPVPNVTCCTFGGKDLDELYITTAREGLTREEILKFPLSGSLFKAKVPFKGIKASLFGGTFRTKNEREL